VAWLLGALVLGPAPPALAHTPAAMLNLEPSHYNGDGRDHWPRNEGQTNEAQTASDTFDGVDRLWSLRGIATAETRFYEWHECEAGTCRLIARDSTPTLSTPAPGVDQIAAFEATYDIPSALQVVRRTFRTFACIEGPPRTEAHCVADQTGIHFDNGQDSSEHALTDAGQITQPTHGAAVANAGFTAVASTTQSDIGRILFCLDEGTNPFTDEDADPADGCDEGSVADPVPDDSPACGSVPVGADCWEVRIDPPDDSEFSLGIVEQDDPTGRVESGRGDCQGDTVVGGDGSVTGDDCQFDKIYLTSVVNPPGSGGQACLGFEDDARNQVVGTPAGEELVGSSGPDVICGLDGKDVIRANGGRDVLLGGRGRDRLFGGRGRDRLFGGHGRDRLLGGRGRDRLFGDTKADLLEGGPGKDRLNGGPGRDRCMGSGDDRVTRCERS
jgi:Ca2+-binding RTX toxin-like protein